jgi:hypothetical protein
MAGNVAATVPAAVVPCAPAAEAANVSNNAARIDECM